MSSMSSHHETLDENGQGKCSVPMFSKGGPAGFCDSPAYGNRVHGSRYNGYVPGLACPIHGGPDTRVFKDGNMFCAVHHDFINLQESYAGFGRTPEEARKQLITGQCSDCHGSGQRYRKEDDAPMKCWCEAGRQ